MRRLTLALLLALGLAACAPVRDFTANFLNDTTGSLGILIASPNGVTLTPPEPLAGARLDILGDDLTVEDAACVGDSGHVTCSWVMLLAPVEVGIRGRNVSVTASYRLASERQWRHEILR